MGVGVGCTQAARDAVIKEQESRIANFDTFNDELHKRIKLLQWVPGAACHVLATFASKLLHVALRVPAKPLVVVAATSRAVHQPQTI